ncbi:unnamed protein product [Rangifer tarandus platyrhynchus]|uniref:Uncharacterized protein n=2 Tax=Rangifer tarandus platyrhynchus TaxID=3082113 RepID=A0ACB0FH90_RANTA|nr:unnamed protein product [Rangifer tarandus platyrhynchus]CAI9711873.1 unnamed protein product [Rangifer tarandus platyrhynchus]
MTCPSSLRGLSSCYHALLGLRLLHLSIYHQDSSKCGNEGSSQRLSQLAKGLPEPELPRAPWGAAYGALSPTQEKELARHSRAHEVPELGRGSLWGKSFSPNANGEPCLSFPHPTSAILSGCSSRWVGSSAQSRTSLRKRPSSRQMKYGAAEELRSVLRTEIADLGCCALLLALTVLRKAKVVAVRKPWRALTRSGAREAR